MNRNLLCIILMLTVAPIVVCTTLVCLDHHRWGDSFNPLNILAMAIFGVITVSMWPTFIPALIIAPFFMRGISRTRFFRTTRLLVLIGLSCLVGAVLGAVVILPPVMILLMEHEFGLVMEWALAGATSGAFTLSLMVWIYRRNASAQPADMNPQE